MPARKLAKTLRGRNRLDHPVEVRYRARSGSRSDRSLVLYRVRIRFAGRFLFDAYDRGRRAELTFNADQVERLTDARTGRIFADRASIRGYLAALDTGRPPEQPPAISEFGRCRMEDVRPHLARRFRLLRRAPRTSIPKGRPH